MGNLTNWQWALLILGIFIFFSAGLIIYFISYQLNGDYAKEIRKFTVVSLIGGALVVIFQFIRLLFFR